MRNEDPIVEIAIRALPNASRSEIVGWMGEILKLKVMAPPDKGRANSEIIALLARKLDLPQRNIQIKRGETQRNKIIAIRGIEQQQLQERMRSPQ